MVSTGTKRTQTVILGFPDVYITGHPFLGHVITETLRDRQYTLLQQFFIQAMEYLAPDMAREVPLTSRVSGFPPPSSKRVHSPGKVRILSKTFVSLLCCY